MYANKRNILELISLISVYGIRHIVLCPGSRNAPLTQSFASNQEFNCYSITDERSAGFFALGLSQSLKAPVAVCCTSGSALLNLLPAVSEAYYQQLPLLLISADRPTEWIGQMDSQTIPQSNMASTIFKKSVHLPEIKDNSQLWYCNRLINEALLSLTHNSDGPVHINIPLSEPLFDFSIGELPTTRKITRTKLESTSYQLPESLVVEWQKAQRPLIIVGQQPYSKEINETIRALSDNNDCVILGEQIANLSPYDNIICNFDSILYAYPNQEELKPDLVIYFGGHIVSKRLKTFIRNNQPENLWLVSPNGEVIDTLQCLTTIIEAQPLDFLNAILKSKIYSGEMSYRSAWKSYSAQVEAFSGRYQFSDFSDLYVMKQALSQLPSCYLQLGNSSIVRNAQLFDLPEIKEVFCNRGTSGIEGSMSTTVGFAAAKKELTFLYIGDLSFFYDMNALWNGHISKHLRILVFNNGNGQIFNVLPSLDKSEIRDKFIAAKHNTSVEAWVKDNGFEYLSAKNKIELDDSLIIFNDINIEKSLVLEVFTDAEISENDYKAYYKHLKI